jgi:imidazolonepropionase-like amidohydrolase
MVMAGALGAGCGTPPADFPDRIFVNGRIWTGDTSAPQAQALAVTGNRVTAIGDDTRIRALAGVATQVVELDGRRVVPGFNDAHWHLPARQTADLAGAGTVECLQRSKKNRPSRREGRVAPDFPLAIQIDAMTNDGRLLHVSTA